MKKILPLIIAVIAIIGASCSAGTATTVTVGEDGNVVAINGDAIPVEADGGIGDGADPLPEPEPEPEPYTGPVWDDTVYGYINAQNLAFTDVEDAAPAFAGDVAVIRSNMAVAGASRTFREDYWASYIVLGHTACHALTQDYDNAMEENWSRAQMNEVLDSQYAAIGEWAREWLVGMTYFSDDEVAEAFIASAGVGGCEDLFWEMVDFGNGLI